jgi:hypothetical protein
MRWLFLLLVVVLVGIFTIKVIVPHNSRLLSVSAEEVLDVLSRGVIRCLLEACMAQWVSILQPEGLSSISRPDLRPSAALETLDASDRRGAMLSNSGLRETAFSFEEG